MLLPVISMLIGTAADVTLAVDDPLRQFANFIGAPVVALLIAVLVSFWSFGTHRRTGHANPSHPILLGGVIAGMMRIAVGSATVAITIILTTSAFL